MSWKVPLKKKSTQDSLRLSQINQHQSPTYIKSSVTPQNHPQPSKRFKLSNLVNTSQMNTSVKSSNQDRSLTPRRALQQINKNQGELVTNNFSYLRKEITKKGLKSSLNNREQNELEGSPCNYKSYIRKTTNKESNFQDYDHQATKTSQKNQTQEPFVQKPKHKENSYLIPKYDRRNFNGPTYNINQQFLLSQNQNKNQKKPSVQNIAPSKNYSEIIQKKNIQKLNLTTRPLPNRPKQSTIKLPSKIASLQDKNKQLNKRLIKTGSYNEEEQCNYKTQLFADRQGEKLSDYQFQGKVLGEGAFAVVRQAKNIITNQWVAIKTYNRLKMVEDEQLKNVKREIMILAKTDHPNLIKAHNSFENVRNIHVVMDYAGKINLKKYVEKGSLNAIQIKNIFEKITRAVSYLHQNQITHRDLKLENIVLNHELEPSLVDFGFAVDHSPEGIPKFGNQCGTPNYMAPELFAFHNSSNGREDSYKSDVWSLGVIFYMMNAQGEFPFKAKTEKELYSKALNVEIEDLEKIIDERCLELLLFMFNPDPFERPSAKDILNHSFFCQEKSNSHNYQEDHSFGN